MSLKTLIATMKGGQVLIPVLQDYIAKYNRQVRKGMKSKKQGTIRDARLTITAMENRIAEFNHGDEIEGEKFHPSRLSTCLRQTWFDRMDAPREKVSNKDEFKNHLVFEVGTYFHILMMNLIERAGIMEAREVAIDSEKYKTLGHCDVVVIIDGVRYGVELKTINLRGFASVAKQPLHGHKMQVHAYMKPLGLEWMIILYYCKETSECREHVIQFDQRFYDQYVKARITRFFRHLRDVTLPDREESGNCAYCSFADICYNKKQLNKFMATL